MKELEFAEKCLQEAIKTEDNNHKKSLIFQVALQLARFCQKMKKEVPSEKEKEMFEKYEKTFRKFASIIRKY